MNFSYNFVVEIAISDAIFANWRTRCVVFSWRLSSTVKNSKIAARPSSGRRKQSSVGEVARQGYAETSQMCSGVQDFKRSSCRMNFSTTTAVVFVIFLLAPWIPSSHQEPSFNFGRRALSEEDEGVSQGIQTVLVVAIDGHPEHFGSVQAAVDAVPMWNYLRWVIYIKPGTYLGPVIVPEGKVWHLCFSLRGFWLCIPIFKNLLHVFVIISWFFVSCLQEFFSWSSNVQSLASFFFLFWNIRHPRDQCVLCLE